MVNHDGNILQEDSTFLNHQNRGLRYGDALFETLRAVNGKLIFWEDHYLRLMASMRILRMEIPMDFTMEFLEDQIQQTLDASTSGQTASRVRLSVFRKKGGLYLPKTNDVSFVIETTPLKHSFFVLNEGSYEVELFKDFYVASDMLSNLKTNNRIINIVGSIFAKENEYQNCLLLNKAKSVIEALNGNIFLVKGMHVKTPPLQDGCIDGVIRRKLIELLGKLDDYELEEASVSPFELQKADEIFITNSIVGIQPITKYRKKTFNKAVARDLLGKLNAAARFS
ncbi:aminotransferase class IV [Pareuzebyella sediminis]|uniref:aminotransferase class IV n=1 Tax=Pareuzebyella sediminis TaxID=2607998 RepID=UPI0011EC6775|nr:aminotransferase class IV [Pareuzebyella sediminis]